MTGWKRRECDPERLQLLSAGLSVSAVAARLLLHRGFSTCRSARSFLFPASDSLFDPFLFEEMEGAVARVLKAMERGEKILIYGDYDVDGITGTALLLELFKGLNHPADYYIPHRMNEGYGLHRAALRSIRSKGISLVITSDCGTASHAEIADAKDQGLDMIVTDHHQPSADRPPAAALLNPYFPGARSYPFQGLSSVGVAFKLAQAVFKRLGLNEAPLRSMLDLVALGTLADVAPLISENRYCVKEGLALMRDARRPGLRALLRAAKIRPEATDERTVRFHLAPRLNAAGRLYHAGEAVSLLTTESPEEAERLSDRLDRYNKERQKLESEMWTEAERQIRERPETASVAVVASEAWHPGVVGIIASRIVERTSRPAVAIALSPDGTGCGSGRSCGALDLYEAVSECGHRLERFGGHPGAVGLKIRKDRIDLFRNDLEKAVSRRSFSAPPNELPVDAEIEIEGMTFGLWKEIEALGPFGEGNPEPILAARRVRLVSLRREEGRVRFKIRKEGGLTFDVFGPDRFFPEEEALDEGRPVDIAFTPGVVFREGEERIVLNLRGIRAARIDFDFDSKNGINDKIKDPLRIGSAVFDAQ